MAIGIIAEYNPFHNGHIYQLQQAKKLFPGEKIVIILSGKYVQRGEIAIVSFRKRKKIAKRYGANKVVKLPFQYATQAAHIFAEGAIKIAYQNGVDKLIFGSESNNSQMLYQSAKLMIEQKVAFDKQIKKLLKQGFSYPYASAEALKILSNNLIKQPNDILALAYCKAIIQNNYPIKIYPIKRTISYKNKVEQNNFASASLLRQKIKQKQSITKYSPMSVKKYHLIEDHYPRFQKIVRHKSVAQLRKIHLISEGMEFLFKKHIDAPTYTAFVERTTSKRYTNARIKRTMLYVLLNKKHKKTA